MWLLMFRCYLSFRAWPVLWLSNVCTITRLWLLKLNPVCPVTHCPKEFMSNLEPEGACGPAGVNPIPLCHYSANYYQSGLADLDSDWRLQMHDTDKMLFMGICQIMKLLLCNLTICNLSIDTESLMHIINAYCPPKHHKNNATICRKL